MTSQRRIGKYEIIDVLGSGGMGTVYRAFDSVLERVVALKLLHRDHVLNLSAEKLSAGFRNEARAVARLNHPAIVTVFDYEERDPAGAYIAMEYVNGCALDAYVRLRPELHIEDAVSAMQQVLSGLAYAHKQGVVHRDIKPSNLLVTCDGMVKITDFGIAKFGARTLTRTGFLIGTPQYMAPEQYMGLTVDQRCDIHGAGVLLYELLVGTAPYLGSPAELMHKICYEAPAPLSRANPSIPPVFDLVVAKALAKKPEDRYATAREFNDALQEAWRSLSDRDACAALSAEARDIAATIRLRRAAPSSPSAPPGPGDAIHAPAEVRPSEFSRDDLLHVERQLAPIVGPIAKVLVRNTAAVAHSRRQLYELLADELRTPEERSRFLATESRPQVSGATAPPHHGTDSAASGSGTRTGNDLSVETMQRATRLLAHYLGPIATVLVKRSAQLAADESHLYRLLADKLAEPDERERFLLESGRAS